MVLILDSNQHFFPDNTEMPDAMDVVFQTALEYGKTGAVSITIWVSLLVCMETFSSFMHTVDAAFVFPCN